MGQNPLGVVYGQSTLTSALAPLKTDSTGALLVNAGAEGATTVTGSVSVAGGNVLVAQTEGTTVYGALKLNASGELLVANTEGGNTTSLNVSVGTALSTVPGVLGVAVVNTAGSASIGGFYDTTAVSLAAAANLIASVPTTSGVGSPVRFDMPFLSGLVFTPATGQVVAVSYTKSPD
jgi:hypothetical protein